MMDPSLFQRCMFGSGRKGDKECLSLPPKKGGNNGREREMCCSVMRAFLTIQIKFCFYHNRCINSTSSWQNNALMQFWQTQLNIMCRLFTQPPPSLLHLKEKNDPPPEPVRRRVITKHQALEGTIRHGAVSHLQRGVRAADVHLSSLALVGFQRWLRLFFKGESQSSFVDKSICDTQQNKQRIFCSWLSVSNCSTAEFFLAKWLKTE